MHRSSTALVETILISGLALEEPDFVIDAEIELAGSEAGSDGSQTVWIEEVCDEIGRIAEAAGPPQCDVLAPLLTEALLTTFPTFRRVSVTVWEESPHVDTVNVAVIGYRVTQERQKPAARQGRSVSRPRPR
jgi:hypothetical protein